MVKAFWEHLIDRTVRAETGPKPCPPPSQEASVEPMWIGERYPGLAACPVLMSQRTPATERTPAPRRALQRAIFANKRALSMPAHYRRPFAVDGHALPVRYRALRPVSGRPGALEPGGAALAEIVFRGPYSHYSARRPDGDFEIDLSFLEAVATRDDYLDCGGRLVVGWDQGGPHTRYIEAWGRRHAPGDTTFPTIRKRFLAALSNYSTLHDHLIWCHLLVGGTFAVATSETLPVHHPLRQLVHPFVAGTLDVNNTKIDGLILDEYSNVPSYTGYPLDTVYGLIRDTVQTFELDQMDPIRVAETRGVLGDPRFVTVESACEIWRILLAYTTASCEHYLGRPDGPTRAWVDYLDDHVPNGVRSYLGRSTSDALSCRDVGRLVAVLAYTAAVRHSVLSLMTLPYLVHPTAFPTVVPVDGGPPSEGVVAERINSAMIASSCRTMLMGPQTCFPDVFRDRLHDSLRAYWAGVEAWKSEADQACCINPWALMSSIHS